MNPTSFPSGLNERRAALVVGHPGHELVVHGWLERMKPIVCVITDGSGRSKQSRLASTTRTISQAGATSGNIFGCLTDAQAYSALLNHDFAVFTAIAQDLYELFTSRQIDCVAGDAIEGYNPMHDVCRLMIDTAVTLARRLNGREIENLQFSLIGKRNSCREQAHHNGHCRTLDDAAWSRKLTAANAYVELAGEVQSALEQSIDAHRVECLHPAGPVAYQGEQPPFFESYGAKQVAAGHYQQVLRYREHMLPLADALRRYGAGSIQS